MPRKNKKVQVEKIQNAIKSHFKLEFLNSAQKLAYEQFDKQDVLFLLGAAGTGKSHLACAFAISEVLAKRKKKIILTRPIVEAGESLGFLPGSFEEKVAPYMMPMYDCIERCVGREGPQRDIINKAIEIAPIAYCRGRTFHDAVCIFDEAQNATKMQIKLFLTRFGQNSKVIVTGDPNQSDIRGGEKTLIEIVNKLKDINGISVIHFNNDSIVRHPLIAEILNKLEENF
jgi:phosphate starvation-inducible PhoH-like protein